MKVDLTPRRIFQYSCLALLAAAVFFGSLACSEGNPVAPVGTILTISANPSQITLNGTSEITIVGRRADGNPLASGTEIRLSTDLGSIPAIVSTDASGTARATLRGDGRTGPAVVMATTGNGDSTAEITVQVGDGDASKPMLLVSVSPDTVPVASTATVTVIARRADGTLFGAGETVILTTTLGSLNPDRPVTTSEGTATSTLNTGSQEGRATITAILGSSDAATTEVVIQDAVENILLSASPETIDDADATINLTAVVVNAKGDGLSNVPVTFEIDFGELSNGTVVLTDGNGIADNVYTVKDADVQSGVPFDITAKAFDGDGAEKKSVVTIKVR